MVLRRHHLSESASLPRPNGVDRSISTTSRQSFQYPANSLQRMHSNSRTRSHSGNESRNSPFQSNGSLPHSPNQAEHQPGLKTYGDHQGSEGHVAGDIRVSHTVNNNSYRSFSPGSPHTPVSPLPPGRDDKAYSAYNKHDTMQTGITYLSSGKTDLIMIAPLEILIENDILKSISLYYFVFFVRILEIQN